MNYEHNWSLYGNWHFERRTVRTVGLNRRTIRRRVCEPSYISDDIQLSHNCFADTVPLIRVFSITLCSLSYTCFIKQCNWDVSGLAIAVCLTSWPCAGRCAYRYLAEIASSLQHNQYNNMIYKHIIEKIFVSPIHRWLTT